jgi:hypothetical protein
VLAPALACALGALGATSLGAQAPGADSARARPLWVTAGIGPGGDEEIGDLLGVGASVAFEHRPGRIVVARTTYLEEFCLFGCARPGRWLEVGALYGVAAHSRWVGLSLAGGVALLSGRPVENFVSSRGRVTTVGVPLEAQLHLRPLRWLGVGVTGAANLSSAGVLPWVFAGVQLGRFGAPATRAPRARDSGAPQATRAGPPPS